MSGSTLPAQPPLWNAKRAELDSYYDKPEPCCFVIFSISGDLTHRLIVPALYNLAEAGLLPDPFCIVGIVRKPMSESDLRRSLMQGLETHATRPVKTEIADKLLNCMTCVEADPSDQSSFDTLSKACERLETRTGTCGNRLLYLAVPPKSPKHQRSM